MRIINKISIAVLLTAIAFTADAQFTAGVKAGINIAKENYGDDFYNTSSHTYFCGGLFANRGFGKHFAGQAELMYSGEGTEENYTYNTTKVTGVVTINRINVPVLIQYKTPVGVYAETGPQIGFVLSAKGKYTDGNYDFKKNTQPVLFSWCIGAGYNFTNAVPGLGLNARFAAGLSRIDKGSTNANTIRGNTFSITASYAFLRPKK